MSRNTRVSSTSLDANITTPFLNFKLLLSKAGPVGACTLSVDRDARSSARRVPGPGLQHVSSTASSDTRGHEAGAMLLVTVLSLDL